MKGLCLALAVALPACAASPPSPPAPATPRRAEAAAHPALAQAPLALPESLFLSSVKVEPAPDLAPGEIELVVSREDSGFGELTRRGGRRDGDRVRVDPGKLRPVTEPAAAGTLACSFVVDCDAPPLVSLAARARQRFGEHPTVAELESFTDEAIPKKNLARSFDIASVVARRGEGDCTEHAVLLAALARTAGIPARVVTGIVVFAIEGDAHQAMGHAWVETHRDGAFHIADAAMVDVEKKLGKKIALTYLPIATLEDESVRFGAKMLEQPGIMDVRSVRIPSVRQR